MIEAYKREAIKANNEAVAYRRRHMDPETGVWPDRESLRPYDEYLKRCEIYSLREYIAVFTTEGIAPDVERVLKPRRRVWTQEEHP